MELLNDKKSQTEPPGEGKYADKINIAVSHLRRISTAQRIFGDIILPVCYRGIGWIGGDAKFSARMYGLLGFGIGIINDT